MKTATGGYKQDSYKVQEHLKKEKEMGDLDAIGKGLEAEYRKAWYQNYNQRKRAGTEGAGGSRTSLEKQHRHTQALDTRRWSMARESKILLSESKNSADAFLQFWVNPNECSWQVGLRSAVAKTAGGAVHHEIQQLDRFKLANFTRFDLPTLNISFQAGITTPGGYNHIDNGDIPNIMPHGLANFYDFLDLLDQPNTTDQGLPNYVNIMYVSPMHGDKGIWLRGFFTEDGVSWKDSADNPNTINSWTASFIVCSSNPPLNQLRQSFRPSVPK